MSKQAEEAALKAYPFSKGEVVATGFGSISFDQHYDEREGFIKGYEQAEKDTIERVCDWLEEHLPIIVNYYDDDLHEDAYRAEFINLFRTQIKEE